MLAVVEFLSCVFLPFPSTPNSEMFAATVQEFICWYFNMHMYDHSVATITLWEFVSKNTPISAALQH